MKMQYIICPSGGSSRDTLTYKADALPLRHSPFRCAVQFCIIPNITTEDYTYCYGGKLKADPAKCFRPLINRALYIMSGFHSLIV